MTYCVTVKTRGKWTLWKSQEMLLIMSWSQAKKTKKISFFQFFCSLLFSIYLTALNVGMIIYFLTSSYASNPKGLYGSPYPSRINMDFWLWILSRFHMLMSVVLNNCRLYGWKVLFVQFYDKNWGNSKLLKFVKT